MGKTKLTQQEIQEWDELYEYVRSNILKYDNTQAIPRSLILRLKGLSTGKYIENRSIQDKAKYSYKTVLYTFKACETTILNAIRIKSFRDETAKFNYICKIVENNLNDVYMRLQRAKKSQEGVSQADTQVLNHQSSTYKSKQNKKQNKRLEELW